MEFNNFWGRGKAPKTSNIENVLALISNHPAHTVDEVSESNAGYRLGTLNVRLLIRFIVLNIGAKFLSRGVSCK